MAVPKRKLQKEETKKGWKLTAQYVECPQCEILSLCKSDIILKQVIEVAE